MIFAEDFQALSPTLFHWSLFDTKVKCDLTSHAWLSDQGLIFFDPVNLAAPALEALTDNRPPLAVFLTNSNHARAAHWFKKKLSIPIVAPASSIDQLEITVDMTLDQFSIPAAIEIIPLEGGPAGETAYFIHQNKALIIGDAIIHLSQTGLDYLPDKYCLDGKRLHLSCQSLLSLSPDYICFAHGTPIVQQAAARLHSLLTSN